MAIARTHCLFVVAVAAPALAISLTAVQPSGAATLTWNGGSSATWDVTSNNWNGAGVPTPWGSTNGTADSAWFSTSGATANATGNSLYVNNLAFVNPSTINGGTLNVTGTNISYLSSSTGTTNIGSTTVFNTSTTGSTTLTCTSNKTTLLFSGPLFATSLSNSGNVSTTGTGNFIFGGGTVTIPGQFQEAANVSTGEVVSILPGTTLTCGTYSVGTAATLTVGGTMNVNSIISGNNASAGPHLLNGAGVINTTNIYGTAGTGLVEFSNGVLNVSGSALIGKTAAMGAARGFQQDSGTVTVTSSGDMFTIGLGATSGTGSYTMNGGTLNVPSEYVELCYSSPGVLTALQVSSSAGGSPTANVYGISFGSTANNGTQNGNGLVKLGNGASRLVIGAGGIIAASSGVLQIQLGSGTLASSAPWSTTMPITLNGNGAGLTNIDASSGTITLGGAISGSNKGLQEIGSGLLVLSGMNNYTGGTTVSGGTLQVGDGVANVGGLTSNISTSSGAVVLFAVPSSNTATYSNAITGSGSLVVAGGTLQLGDGFSNNGTVSIPVTNNGALVLANPQPLSLAAAIGGNGPVFANGPGSLALSGSNLFTGGLTLANNATLYVNGNNALGTGTLTINGGVIDSTSAGIALGNVPQNWNADFTFGGTNNLNFGAGAVLLGSSRTITLNGGVLTVGGPISDGGAGYSLSVTSPSGTAALVLGGTSTYSGGTNVNSGALYRQWRVDRQRGCDGPIRRHAGRHGPGFRQRRYA